MKVFVLGGDGFCGWPCAVNLADDGHDVVIVDNLSRRKIDLDLGVESLTPIATIFDRLKAWAQRCRNDAHAGEVERAKQEPGHDKEGRLNLPEPFLAGLKPRQG